MNRKKIISKMNTDEQCKLLQFVRNLFVFFGIVFCLIAFSVTADEASDTEKKDEEVVQQTEKKPAAPAKSTESKDAKKDPDTPNSDSDGTVIKLTKEVITGTADKMERDQKAGITILIGEINQAKTVRLNEQGVEIGFLNADRITLKTDPETGQTTEIIAVGNVEIRDQDIFATCDHATMNNLTNIIVLKDNVVVLQNKDRLETKLFTFNRTTGKQTGEGAVKFKVTVTQATPAATPEESSSDSKDSSETPSTGEENTDSLKTENATEKKSDDDSDKAETEEKTTPSDTDKEEKDSESEKDQETEPSESEETESEETDEAEEAEETE